MALNLLEELLNVKIIESWIQILKAWSVSQESTFLLILRVILAHVVWVHHSLKMVSLGDSVNKVLYKMRYYVQQQHTLQVALELAMAKVDWWYQGPTSKAPKLLALEGLTLN